MLSLYMQGDLLQAGGVASERTDGDPEKWVTPRTEPSPVAFCGCRGSSLPLR